MSSLHHFLAELRRRKVYRVAIVYTAVAFVIWQVVDIALPSLGLPDSAVTLVLVLTLIGFPFALVLAWAYELRPEEPRPAVESGAVETSPTEAGLLSPAMGVSPRSIAILPFENMSAGEGSEYFADGIAEELTHVLGRVRRLRVAARTSAFAFKGERLDVREIGRKLNVAHVIEGSVRRSGNRLRVTAQLIDASDGYHIWSDRYEREIADVFEIQDDIVGAVVEKLLETLGAGEDTPAGTAPLLARTDDLDAYDLYLRGTHELRAFDGPSLKEAVELFEQAVALDGTFAPAHAALADALTMQAIGFAQGPQGDLLSRARSAADAAIELDPNLPAAHVARALSLMYRDWAFAEARAELEHALVLNPSSADAHRWSEFFWTYVENDSDAALDALARAAELDPLDRRVPIRMATVHYLFGRAGEAEAMLRGMLLKEPGSPIVMISLMDTLTRVGRAEEAALLAMKLPMTAEVPDVMLGVTGVVFGLAGHEDRARRVVSELEVRSEAGYSAPFWRALPYAALGELDRAFEHLEDAVEQRDGGLLYLSMVPKIPGFQEDPRFVSTLRLMGLGHLLTEV
jgi:TolB-like protein/tetratricopeptide (TPR) repeat protein